MEDNSRVQIAVAVIGGCFLLLSVIVPRFFGDGDSGGAGSSPVTGAPGATYGARPNAAGKGVSLLGMSPMPPDQSMTTGSYTVGSAAIGGQNYDRVLLTDLYSPTCQITAEYNIGYKYQKFSADVGMLDQNVSSTPVTITVYLDEKEAISTSVGPGRPKHVEIPVGGKYKLALNVMGNCDDTRAGWINPVLLP